VEPTLSVTTTNPFTTKPTTTPTRKCGRRGWCSQMNGGGELVPADDVFLGYPTDSHGRYILKPSGNS